MTTNLSGSLSEFTLAEVLSLLGMGGRTARMQVTTADAVGCVHLVDGRVSSATADSARAALLRGVVAALPVPADDLAGALAAGDPVRALVDSGAVDRGAAQEVAAEQCTEAIGAMLDWTSGEFAVWVGAQDPSDIGVRLDVGGLVTAARARSQEWHELRAALPGSDSVLALVPDVSQAPVVDRDDWAVLARVDGRRTLAEVLAAMGASPLAAGNRLVQLMGRGLVAVQVGGGDVEQAQVTAMLEAFETGPVVEPIELEVAPDPDLGPEVPDLFGTDPQAVAEWQLAGGGHWVVEEPTPVVTAAADPGADRFEESVAVGDWAALVAPDLLADPEPVLVQPFAAGVERAPYELEPIGFAAEPEAFAGAEVGYATESAGYPVESAGYATESAGYATESAGYPAEPIGFAPETTGSAYASAYAVESAALVVEPVAEPVAEPVVALEATPEVAESFAWSPWAQEMGLGEPPAVIAPAPVGQDFAELLATGDGHGHTDAFPVPQVPAAGAAYEHVAPIDPVDQDALVSFVPQPRIAGDGVVSPSAQAQPVGAHAIEPAPAQVPDAAPASATEVARGESAPDPLAGGLLAHLMSSVRGL